MARARSSSRTAICAVCSARISTSALDETRSILEWIASTLGSDTYVNLMDQYFPAGKVGDTAYPEINRRLTSAEFRGAQRIASDLGLQRLDVRRPHPRLRRRMMLVQGGPCSRS